MRYVIERESRVRFDQPVREHHVQLRIAPWEDANQRLATCSLTVEPAADPASHRDSFGNLVHRFAVMAPHEGLVTRLRAEVRTLLSNPFDFDAVPPARELDWIAYSLREAPRLWDFLLHRSAFTPALPEAVGEEAFPAYDSGIALLTQIQTVLAWIGAHFDRDRQANAPCADLKALLKQRCGGASDLAHLLIALMRTWGIPARYAVGYIDPGYFEPDEDEVEQDAEALPQTMHAWAEILIPGAGWRGFDPFLGLLADATYIRVAVGRDAADVRTERATYKGDAGEPDRLITLQVTRLD